MCPSQPDHYRPYGAFSGTFVHLDGSAVLALRGELDIDTATELEHLVDLIVTNGPPVVIVDLSQLDFLDASGISALVKAQDRILQSNRQLTIQHPRRMVAKVLATCGLSEYVETQSQK